MRALIAGDRSSAFKRQRFVTARFAIANLGFSDLDEISQPGTSNWHSTFRESWLLASADIWHFVFITWRSGLNLAVPKVCAWEPMFPLAPPSYATVSTMLPCCDDIFCNAMEDCTREPSISGTVGALTNIRNTIHGKSIEPLSFAKGFVETIRCIFMNNYIRNFMLYQYRFNWMFCSFSLV